MRPEHRSNLGQRECRTASHQHSNQLQRRWSKSCWNPGGQFKIYSVTSLSHYWFPFCSAKSINELQQGVGENIISPNEGWGGRPTHDPAIHAAHREPSPAIPQPRLLLYSLLFLSSAPYNQVKARERSCWPHIWLYRGEAVSAPQGKVSPHEPLNVLCFASRLTSNFLSPFHRTPQADGAPNFPTVSQRAVKTPACHLFQGLHSSLPNRLQPKERGCTGTSHLRGSCWDTEAALQWQGRLAGLHQSTQSCGKL